MHLGIFAFDREQRQSVVHSPRGTVTAMRWERLFTDLEAEVAELAGQDREAEIADRTRAEVARTSWVDRVRAAIGSSVRFRLLGADMVEGTVLQVGSDWLLLRAGAHDVLVPVGAVVGVEGTGLAAVAPPALGEVGAPTWSAAWRVLARDRAAVRVVRVGGSTVHGVPVRVGADFVELDPALGQRRRDPADLGRVLVPYAAITAAYTRTDPSAW
jgi:hypothetical protein